MGASLTGASFVIDALVATSLWTDLGQGSGERSPGKWVWLALNAALCFGAAVIATMCSPGCPSTLTSASSRRQKVDGEKCSEEEESLLSSYRTLDLEKIDEGEKGCDQTQSSVGGEGDDGLLLTLWELRSLLARTASTKEPTPHQGGKTDTFPEHGSARWFRLRVELAWASVVLQVKSV